MQLLGGMSVDQFLAEHWQKKPLLVRQAIPGFQGFLTPKDLCRLASKDDVGARVVKDAGVSSGDARKRFRLDAGPFRIDADKTPAERWTLLVQHIEDHHDGGWPLLLQFADVVPLSRIGDLMVSWAKKGGSVGAHVDAYDVFLLQGSGKRRWQIDSGPPHIIVPGDVRTLKNFTPVNEWVLEAGDLLYLPPNIGHHGVAVDDDCMTWSIGYTAPSAEQLLQNWLAYQSQQHEHASGWYEDKDLTRADRPRGVLGDDVVARMQRLLQPTTPSLEAVTTFAGRLLTGRPDVEFAPPKPKLNEAAWAQKLKQKGTLSLQRKTRMLARADRVFVNGEEQATSPATTALWSTLASTRTLSLPLPREFAAESWAFFAGGFFVLS